MGRLLSLSRQSVRGPWLEHWHRSCKRQRGLHTQQSKGLQQSQAHPQSAARSSRSPAWVIKASSPAAIRSGRALWQLTICCSAPAQSQVFNTLMSLVRPLCAYPTPGSQASKPPQAICQSISECKE